MFSKHLQIFSSRPKIKQFATVIISVVAFVYAVNVGFAQNTPVPQSTAYVPLIGITSVPDPLALPQGSGHVTYHYAIKNFLQGVPLTDIQVHDDACSEVIFVTGDDNANAELDFSETWRYICDIDISVSTRSTATVTGTAYGITATHSAYAMVVVGVDIKPPLVSIVNITKIAYPLSLPAEGGVITFTYRVNNPGVVPLSGLTVVDDKCSAMSGKLGDINGNNLLDVNEVWTYTCSMTLRQTTLNTVTATAFSNGLKAVGTATVNVIVDSPTFPDVGSNISVKPSMTMTTWLALLGILATVSVFFVLYRKNKLAITKNPSHSFFAPFLVTILAAGIVAGGFLFILLPQISQLRVMSNVPAYDGLFGWKYPVAKFPSVGSGGGLAYSDIRDPGGIPQGLPVRLKIPTIGVDSAIEDALITPDGRMDVPAGSVNVAWFALGPHPGEEGSAVIGGHFGIQNGVPFVFYDLDKLKPNDKIYIVDDKGDTLAFVVRSTKLFDRNADATTVFTSEDGLAHLNLITCEGIWNQVNGTYPSRLVIFTDAIPSEGPAPIAVVVQKTLSFGSRGIDVVVLQTALVEKKLLVMPKGVPKGYFGSLTRSAVARYQVSVGLPSSGVFNQATRDKFSPSPSLVAVNPALPIAAIPPVSSFNTTLLSFFRNLYATPVAGFITSVLVLAILFVIFKIVRL